MRLAACARLSANGTSRTCHGTRSSQHVSQPPQELLHVSLRERLGLHSYLLPCAAAQNDAVLRSASPPPFLFFFSSSFRRDISQTPNYTKKIYITAFYYFTTLYIYIKETSYFRFISGNTIL